MIIIHWKQSSLHQELQQLLEQLQANPVEYTGRSSEVASLADWIAKGDHSQAEFKARQILTRQAQFLGAKLNGLPPVLQRLVDQVHANPVGYAGGASEVAGLADWIAKGDHSQAEFKARQILTRQAQFLGAKLNGLPPVLQQLVDQVHANPVDYAGGASEVAGLADWIAKGDHSQAEFKARQILTRQAQFLDAKLNGLPPQLQQLVDQVHANPVDYAGGASEVAGLADWIAKGDHSQAEFKARQILNRQAQFLDAKLNGLPPQLQQLVDQVHANPVDYAGRANEIASLADWIAKGDHSQAEFKARQIITRQENICGAVLQYLRPAITRA